MYRIAACKKGPAYASLEASPCGRQAAPLPCAEAARPCAAPSSLRPMPARVEPCLALLKSKPPTGPEWTYEIKWDGYRVAVHIEQQRVRVITRGGHDWTHRFPGIVEAAKRLGVATAILDGEAVVLDEQGGRTSTSFRTRLADGAASSTGGICHVRFRSSLLRRP
jgi:ATP-dependent DNA ligase